MYGPPGTGKSSLIAAMANYLNYDIYDLDLMDVGDNKRLKQIILDMSNRSILVIEDIDCRTEKKRKKLLIMDTIRYMDFFKYIFGMHKKYKIFRSI